ncbi:MAG: 4-hydroxythreonine-4-phosphate dehydrogenase PdxA [Gemmataceae bacterium]
MKETVEKSGLATLLITMGDVAGIGPEIIAKAWPELLNYSRPVVVGDPRWLERAASLVGQKARIDAVQHPSEARPSKDSLPCVNTTSQDLRSVAVGQVSAAAGRAAYDFLVAAIDWNLAGEADGIVTAPLHKEGLRAAGLNYPGHTEILAERTGAKNFAMLLSCDGLTVAHVTLHMALRDVFGRLTTDAILEKIFLVSEVVSQLQPGKVSRIGVAALNPHASDGGLFGDEESRLIQPAVARAKKAGIDVAGPLPSDMLFVRAHNGEFDGIVAMYHDQGHIALKLLGGLRAVNISAGLPIVRTSVAHGTAYDIAGRGIAEGTSLVEAVRIAAQLAAARRDLLKV